MEKTTEAKATEKIQATTVLQVFSDVVINGSHGRRVVELPSLRPQDVHDGDIVHVASVRPQDVRTLMLIVTMVKKQDTRWKLHNAEQMKMMKEGVDILKVLESCVLPALLTKPHSASLLRGLRFYSSTIAKLAKDVGGSFFFTSQRVCGRLLNCINCFPNKELLVPSLTPSPTTSRPFSTGSRSRSEPSQRNRCTWRRRRDRDHHVHRLRWGIRVEGLPQLFDRTILAGDTHNRRLITVAALRPRDVTSMLVVLELAKAEGWKSTNLHRLRSMKEATEILCALESVVLPALADQPDNTPLLNTLLDYTDILCKRSRASGGNFASSTSVFCDKLMSYIHQAREADGEGKVKEKLISHVAPLVSQATALLDTDATVAQK